MSRAASRCRGAANRVVAGPLVAGALAAIALAERTRPGWGQRTAAVSVRAAAMLCGVRFEVKGRIPRPPEPVVVVANHSSPLDIAALLAALPQIAFVAGADLFAVPLLGAALRALSAIPVDRRSRSGVHLDLAGPLSASGRPVAVFPEGAIAAPGTRLPFRRGGFAMAIAHQATVVPVAIHGSSRLLPPRSRLGVRPGTVTVEFLEAIPTAGMGERDRWELCRRAEGLVVAALGPADGGTSPDRDSTAESGWSRRVGGRTA